MGQRLVEAEAHAGIVFLLEPAEQLGGDFAGWVGGGQRPTGGGTQFLAGIVRVAQKEGRGAVRHRAQGFDGGNPGSWCDIVTF